MGIKGLRQFIRSKFPNVIKPFSLFSLRNKKVSFDPATYMYKYMATNPNNWMNMLLNAYYFFKEHNIHVVTCLDGQTPSLKIKECLRRQAEKNKLENKVNTLTCDLIDYQNTGQVSDMLKDTIEDLVSSDNVIVKKLLKKTDKKDIKNIDIVKMIEDYIDKINNRIVKITPEDKEIFSKCISLLGFSIINAPYEAETLACLLNKYCGIDAVISEDSDVLAYGADLSLFDLNLKDGICMSIKKSELLSEMEFTEKQFLDFCILCGTDYNSNIKNIGPVKAFSLIKSKKSIDNIKDNYDMEHIKYKQIRKMFTFKHTEDKKESKDGDKDSKKSKKSKIYTNDKIKEYTSKCVFTETNVDYDKIKEYFEFNNLRYSLDKLKKLYTTKIIYEEELDEKLSDDIVNEELENFCDERIIKRKE